MSAFSTIKSMGDKKKADAAQAKAMNEQRAIERLKQQREVRQAMREARIKRATIAQGGESLGATGSSAVTGGVGSVTSQLASVTSFLDQQGAMADKGANYLAQAAKFTASSNTWGAAASAGGTIFENAGSASGLFGGKIDPKVPTGK